MSYVTVNSLTVPAEHFEEVATRFANRPGKVDHVDGFERFELFRPADGNNRWLVVTHWRDKAAFEAWDAARTPRTESGPMTHELWQFEVEQSTDA